MDRLSRLLRTRCGLGCFGAALAALSLNFEVRRIDLVFSIAGLAGIFFLGMNVSRDPPRSG